MNSPGRRDRICIVDYGLGNLRSVQKAFAAVGAEAFLTSDPAEILSAQKSDGIAAAAIALDLEFISLFQVRYDLVIPKEHAEDALLQPLFETLNSLDFRKQAASLPGYDISQMGKRKTEIG